MTDEQLYAFANRIEEMHDVALETILGAAGAERERLRISERVDWAKAVIQEVQDLIDEGLL